MVLGGPFKVDSPNLVSADFSGFLKDDILVCHIFRNSIESDIRMSLTVRGTLRTDTSLGEANVTDQSEMEKKTERWFTKATLALTNANIACKRIIYASYLIV